MSNNSNEVESCRLCQERLVECPESGLCKRCYAWMHYWMNRSVTDFMAQLERIGMWHERANRVGGKLTRGKKHVGKQ